MASLTGNVVIGVSGSGSTLVLTTQLWANNSTTFSSGSFGVANGAVVTAESKMIVFTTLGQAHNGSSLTLTGSFTARNCILGFIGSNGGNNIGGSNNLSLDLEDVTITRNASSYAFIGNFHNRNTLATYRFVNVNLYGQTSDFFAGFNFFTGAINASSSFSNVNLWNGETGDSARGAIWQTTSRAIYNNITFGPFGTFVNNANNQFMLFRVSNQGNEIARRSHMGLFCNTDIRAYGQISNSAYNAFIDVDTGSAVSFVNWLPGVPANSNNFGFNTLFVSSGNSAGGLAIVFIATNPTTTDGGDHKFTFSSAQITNQASTNATTVQGQNGVFIPDFSSGWDVSTPPTFITDQVVENVSDGIFFRNQYFETTHTNTLSDSQFHTRTQPIADLQSDREYRKYSYLQQPTSALFGRMVTVSVPPNNASDVQVETARAGGYDIFNGADWDTETSVDDIMDTPIVELGTAWDTPTKALTEANFQTQTTSRTVSQLVAMVKAHIYSNVVTNTGVGTANTKIDLPYIVTGSTLNFGALNIILSNTATAVSMTSTQITIPCDDLNSDSVLDTIISTGTITASRDGNANIADSTGVGVRITSNEDDVIGKFYDSSGDVVQVASANTLTIGNTTNISLPANTDLTVVYKKVGHIFGKVEFNTGNGTDLNLTNIQNSNIDTTTDNDISAFDGLYDSVFYGTATTENGISFTANQISFVLDEINLAGRLEESKLIFDTAFTNEAGLDAFFNYSGVGIGGQFMDIRTDRAIIDTDIIVLSRDNVSSANQLTQNEESFFGLPLFNLSGTSIRSSAISNGARVTVDSVSILNTVDVFTLTNVINDVIANNDVQNAFNNNLLETQINGSRTVRDELVDPFLDEESIQEIVSDELDIRIPPQETFEDKFDLIEGLATPTTNFSGGSISEINEVVTVTLADGFPAGVGFFEISFPDFPTPITVNPRDTFVLHIEPSVAMTVDILVEMVVGVSGNNTFHVNNYSLVAGVNELDLGNSLTEPLENVRVFSISIQPTGVAIPNGATIQLSRILLTDFTIRYRDTVLDINTEGTFVPSSEYLYEKQNGDKFRCYTQFATTELPFDSTETIINNDWTVEYVNESTSVDIGMIGGNSLPNVDLGNGVYNGKLAEIVNTTDSSDFSYVLGEKSIIDLITVGFTYDIDDEQLLTFRKGDIPNRAENDWLQGVLWYPETATTGNLSIVLTKSSLQDNTEFRLEIGTTTINIGSNLVEIDPSRPDLCIYVEEGIESPFSGSVLGSSYFDFNLTRIANNVIPSYPLTDDTLGTIENNLPENIINRLQKKPNVIMDHQFRLTGISPLIIGTGTNYSGNSFNVSGQDNSVNDVYFNDLGTIMFIIGVGSGSVHRYDLDIGFNLTSSNVTYINSFDVSTQESSPRGLAFNDLGTKMFVVGVNSGIVYEYDLDIGFDLSTDSDVRYSGNSFSVSGQDLSPRGVTFNDTGRKMYISGATNDSIFEYDLDIGFDLSTASNVRYSGNSLDVSEQDGTPNEVVFNTDGRRMFMIGDDNNTAYQYSLSNAFDLSTASYDDVFLDVTGQDTNPSGIFFNTDGTRMFISGASSDSIYQYNLSTGFDLALDSGGQITLRGKFTIGHADEYYNRVQLAEGTTPLDINITTQTGDIILEGDIQEFVPIISEAFFDETNSNFVVLLREPVPVGLEDLTVSLNSNNLAYSEANTFIFRNVVGEFYAYYWSNVTVLTGGNFDITNDWVTNENVGTPAQTGGGTSTGSSLIELITSTTTGITFVANTQYRYRKVDGSEFLVIPDTDRTTLPFNSAEDTVNSGWTIQAIGNDLEDYKLSTDDFLPQVTNDLGTVSFSTLSDNILIRGAGSTDIMRLISNLFVDLDGGTTITVSSIGSETEGTITITDNNITTYSGITIAFHFGRGELFLFLPDDIDLTTEDTLFEFLIGGNGTPIAQRAFNLADGNASTLTLSDASEVTGSLYRWSSDLLYPNNTDIIFRLSQIFHVPIPVDVLEVQGEVVGGTDDFKNLVEVQEYLTSSSTGTFLRSQRYIFTNSSLDRFICYPITNTVDLPFNSSNEESSDWVILKTDDFDANVTSIAGTSVTGVDDLKAEDVNITSVAGTSVTGVDDFKATDVNITSVVGTDVTGVDDFKSDLTESGIAVAVETALLNEGDGRQLIQAIRDAVATINWSASDIPVSDIAQAVITEMQSNNLIEDDGSDKRFTANAIENVLLDLRKMFMNDTSNVTGQTIVGSNQFFANLINTLDIPSLTTLIESLIDVRLGASALTNDELGLIILKEGESFAGVNTYTQSQLFKIVRKYDSSNVNISYRNVENVEKVIIGDV